MPVYPLSEPVFEWMNSLNPPSLRYLKTPVVWNEDVYALGRDCEGEGKLYKYSPSNNAWSSFSVPSSYASGSVLTTYSSELLLIINGKILNLWEFNSNNFAFKESCIKPVPNNCKMVSNIFATSSDEYLLIAMTSCTFDSILYNLLVYNGRDWKFRQLKETESEISGRYSSMVAMDSHTVYEIVDWYNEIGIERALIPNFDEIKDEGMVHVLWKDLEMTSLEEFDELLRGRYSIIIQDQQFYCVGSKGIIFTAFLQPPIVPIVWGNSGVTFDQAPRLVGLPDGALLMIGTIRHQDQGSQLDVIKVSQKGITILY